MSRCRQVRTIIEPFIGIEQTVGHGVYATTAMINNFSIQGGSHLTQSILGALPGFSILHGILNTVEGIAIMTQKITDKDREEDPNYYSSVRINDWTVTEREKYIKGGLQTISGLFLAEGGVEALLGVDTLGLSLLWRLAVNSMIEFVSAMYDLNKLYNYLKISELGLDPEDYARQYAEAKFNTISRVLIKGLACAGWTALAMAPLLGSMAVPLGLACLALSALGILYRNTGNIASFFSRMKDLIDSTPRRRDDSFSPSNNIR
jgi:hypothetical protein